jgi:MarR family 2-MHQ and catechol resistance regulon transcriptional repressor
MIQEDKLIQLMEHWAETYLFNSLAEFFRYLKQSDLSMQQAFALTFLYYNGPCKVSNLCEHMLASPAAASQMVDRLEKRNLVLRTAEPGDRRVRNVGLSEQGRHFVQGSIAARQQWMADIPNKLNPAQQQQVSEALRILVSINQEQAAAVEI